MATEQLRIDGRIVTTLSERLRPGLKAVIVGLNPSPISVAAGHYYQGRLGKLQWSRLERHKILKKLTPGAEDEGAFAQGFGLADLVRRPTPRAKTLARRELETGSRDLLSRLVAAHGPNGERPLILFVFAAAAEAAGPLLEEAGYQTVRLPGPYAARADVDRILRGIKAMLLR